MRIIYSLCPCCKSVEILPVLSVRDFTVSSELFGIWQCNNCTMKFTQSVPDKNNISTYYKSENYISHSDTSKGLINRLYHAVRRKTLNLKKKLIKEYTGIASGNILDVGSGTGAFLNTMLKGSWKVTGLEPDEIARQKSKELYEIESHNSEMLFDLPEQSFDAITMWHVLEHVHDLHPYIIQLKKLLKPKGVLFIAVPNYTCYDEKIYKQFWAAYDVPRHLYHFSPVSMKVLLKQYDLTITSIKPMWFDSFYVSMLSEKYKTDNSNLVTAIWNGLISNVKALFSNKKCSSVIYIISSNK